MAKKVNREKKREFILTKALEEIGKRGLRHTKMEHIARACGIGKGTLYEYFHSKEDLLEEVMNFFFSDYITYTEQVLNKISDPEKWMEKFIELNFKFIWSSSPELKIIFDIWAELAREGRGMDWLKQFYSLWRDRIKDVIEKGKVEGVFSPALSSFSFATFVVASLDCLFLQKTMGLLEGREKEIENDFKKLFLANLRGEK